MNSGQEQLKRIEEKLVKLLAQHQYALRENLKLRKEQEKFAADKQTLKTKINELELQVGLLKSTDSQGATASRAALEKKINTYVKEIDKCIAILGNQA
jgi:chromosome segregation ATPase